MRCEGKSFKTRKFWQIFCVGLMKQIRLAYVDFLKGRGCLSNEVPPTMKHVHVMTMPNLKLQMFLNKSGRTFEFQVTNEQEIPPVQVPC